MYKDARRRFLCGILNELISHREDDRDFNLLMIVQAEKQTLTGLISFVWLQIFTRSNVDYMRDPY